MNIVEPPSANLAATPVDTAPSTTAAPVRVVPEAASAPRKEAVDKRTNWAADVKQGVCRVWNVAKWVRLSKPYGRRECV